MRSLAISLLSISMAVTAAVAQQPPAGEPIQQPPFGEKLEVNAVLIDAVVTDRQGNQLLGLDKDDFLVSENGVVQPLDSLDYFTTRRLLNSTEANAPFKVEQVHEGRYLVFFFDKPEQAQLFGRVALARSAVNHFVATQMTDTDKVAIVGHDFRLKVYSDFTSDKAQLSRALDQVTRFGNGLAVPSSDLSTPSILRNMNRGALIDKTGTVYEALTQLADGLQPIHARKNLVLFSAGIREPGELVRDGVPLMRSRYYEPMIEALNEANVTVYAMNLLPDAPSDPIFHQTLASLAQETNGDYFRYANTYGPALKQVARASAGYYMLSYRTNKTGRGFQKVAVAVKNHPELKVTARNGYTYGY
ncbi:MAG: hypothetical protein NVSMB68_00190 [Thermoanaerobaculia bacterium]